MGHVSPISESCHSLSVSLPIHQIHEESDESCHMYPWVMSRISTGHVTDNSDLASRSLHLPITHIREIMSHVTHINESCLAYQGVLSQSILTSVCVSLFIPIWPLGYLARASHTWGIWGVTSHISLCHVIDYFDLASQSVRLLVTRTARSWTNEIRNGNRNTDRDPKCSSQVSFQTAHLKRNINFDHLGFRFEFRWPFRVSCFRERAVTGMWWVMSRISLSHGTHQWAMPQIIPTWPRGQSFAFSSRIYGVAMISRRL